MRIFVRMRNASICNSISCVNPIARKHELYKRNQAKLANCCCQQEPSDVLGNNNNLRDDRRTAAAFCACIFCIKKHCLATMFYSAAVFASILASSHAFTPAAPQRIMKTSVSMADPWFPASTTTNTVDVADLK